MGFGGSGIRAWEGVLGIRAKDPLFRNPRGSVFCRVTIQVPAVLYFSFMNCSLKLLKGCLYGGLYRGPL